MPSATGQERRMQIGKFIPEEVQRPVRERLLMLRQSRNRARQELTEYPELHMSPSTLTNYELNDLSTMQIWHVYAMAEFLGVDFSELLAYMFATDEHSALRIRDDQTLRMSRLLGLLNEEDQETACSLVGVLVDQRALSEQGKRRTRYTRRPATSGEGS